jgi:glycerol uptake facilitator-like aquaporin
MLLGYWVITLFGEAISGAHFNPAVTLVFMLRKNSKFGTRKLRCIIYVAGQLIGGILSAAACKVFFSAFTEVVITSPIPY